MIEAKYLNDVFNGKKIEESMVKVIVETHYLSNALKSLEKFCEKDAFKMILNSQKFSNKIYHTKQTSLSFDSMSPRILRSSNKQNL